MLGAFTLNLSVYFFFFCLFSFCIFNDDTWQFPQRCSTDLLYYCGFYLALVSVREAKWGFCQLSGMSIPNTHSGTGKVSTGVSPRTELPVTQARAQRPCMTWPKRKPTVKEVLSHSHITKTMGSKFGVNRQQVYESSQTVGSHSSPTVSNLYLSCPLSFKSELFFHQFYFDNS